ncbi:glycosyltransferase family 4 protein [Flavobacterium sp. W20_MBD1_R3]|uniref:glycosyltransferase family 4 protein n=1 Tax=Flavobacterium sp. W20_MBD1_R3 TaxID=3240278 RepID=UPI003F91096C
MKLLFVVPNINNAGGVARVIAVKANYLVEHLGYEVVILTQNGGNFPLFYSFNEKIIFQDMILKGKNLSFLKTYRKQLNSTVKTIKPDIIIVCDNGLKAYLIPFILNNKIPLVLEMHSSRFIDESGSMKNSFATMYSNIIFQFKKKGIKKYDQFVVVTNESIAEWNVKNTMVIPNPLWFVTEKSSELKNKKAIAVGRHTYEKGFDSLLQIWKKIVLKHPDWVLEIYGKSDKNFDLKTLAENLNITDNVVFQEPIQNINEKYLEASFYVMTSRYEGFGMVLIEAMASGLPCIAYDCPCGPRAIITDREDGFLIENGHESDYVAAIETLIANEVLRGEMANKAKLSSKKYDLDAIMQTWNQLFLELKKEF